MWWNLTTALYVFGGLHQKRCVQVEVIFCQVLSLAGQGEDDFLEENTFPLPLFSLTDLTWTG